MSLTRGVTGITDCILNIVLTRSAFRYIVSAVHHLKVNSHWSPRYSRRPEKEVPIRTISQASIELSRPQRDVRMAILAFKIPVIKIGIAFGLTDDAFKTLVAKFVEIDRQAKVIGMGRCASK